MCSSDLGGYEPAQIADIFRTWNTGRLDSYLIEITAEVLAHTYRRTDTEGSFHTLWAEDRSEVTR